MNVSPVQSDILVNKLLGSISETDSVLSEKLVPIVVEGIWLDLIESLSAENAKILAQHIKDGQDDEVILAFLLENGSPFREVAQKNIQKFRDEYQKLTGETL